MKKTIRFLICLLTGAFLLSACGGASDAAPENYGPMLRITLAEADSPDTGYFTGDDLGGNFQNGLAYHHVEDVTIQIDGRGEPLETALRNGEISEEALFCYARMDARAGVCQEAADSRLGVSGYTYHYPDYSLSFTYDIYELPDGSQYPISRCDIFLPVVDGTQYHYGPYSTFYDGETGLPIDREDWGLQFTVSQTTPTGVTLKCSQSGGQQIGQLVVESFGLSTPDGFVETQQGSSQLPSAQFPIPANGEAEWTLDWAESYGSLPAGSYTLALYIADEFTPEQTHPLMKDYHGQQAYTVSITVG